MTNTRYSRHFKTRYGICPTHLVLSASGNDLLRLLNEASLRAGVCHAKKGMEDFDR